jgi:hypothetical protein
MQIRIALHAVVADDAEHAQRVADVFLRNVVTKYDVDEYAHECTEIDDDYHDDNPDEPDAYIVTYCRTFD